MDKFEYKVRAEEIKALIARGDYVQAADIADTIDWRRVKSVMMLCTISDLYKINRRYEDARDMLLLAYDRHPGGRTIVYSLCELSIKMEEFVQAIEYYKEFVQIAPRDSGRYVLQYKLYEAQDVSLEERIAVLEELKKKDYREKWAYELAYLYHRMGLAAKCVEECDELILWFGDGKYVVKAMELKMLHQPLTPEQKKKYDGRFGARGAASGRGMAGERDNSAKHHRGKPVRGSGAAVQERPYQNGEGDGPQSGAGEEAAYTEGEGYGENPVYGDGYGREAAYGSGEAYGREAACGSGEAYGREAAYGSGEAYGREAVAGGEEACGEEGAYTEGAGYGENPVCGDGYDREAAYGSGEAYGRENGWESGEPCGQEGFYADGDGYDQNSGYEAEEAGGRHAGYGAVGCGPAAGSVEGADYGQEGPYSDEGYDNVIQYAGFGAGTEPALAEDGDELDIQVKTMDVGQYNTINLQKELAEGLREVLGEPDHPVIPFAPVLQEDESDTEALDFPQIEMVDEDHLEPEKEPQSEVFFGETGELAPVGERESEEFFPEEEYPEDAYPEDTADGEAWNAGNGEEYIGGDEAGQELPEAAASGLPPVNDDTAEIVMEQLRQERMGMAQEMQEKQEAPSLDQEPEFLVPESSEPPKELADVLAMESDGQLSLVMPDSQMIEKQITGQLSIQDILSEWERMKRENEEKRREEVRQHVLRHTGSMFTEFEESVRDGLLEKLEQGGQDPKRLEEAVRRDLQSIQNDSASGGVQDREEADTYAESVGEADGAVMSERNGSPLGEMDSDGLNVDHTAGDDGEEAAAGAFRQDENRAIAAGEDMEASSQKEDIGEEGVSQASAPAGAEDAWGEGEERAETAERADELSARRASAPAGAEEAWGEGEERAETAERADELSALQTSAPAGAEDAWGEGEERAERADELSALQTSAPAGAEDAWGEGEERAERADELSARRASAPAGAEEAWAEGAAVAEEAGSREAAGPVDQSGKPAEAENEAQGTDKLEPAWAARAAGAKETQDIQDIIENGYPSIGFQNTLDMAGDLAALSEGIEKAGETHGRVPEEAVESEVAAGGPAELSYKEDGAPRRKTEEPALKQEARDDAAEGREEALGRENNRVLDKTAHPDNDGAAAAEGETDQRSGRISEETAEGAAPGHSREDVHREKTEVRSLTREEKELFGSFIQNKSSREQLVSAIDKISMAAYTGNLIVTGGEGMDTMALAKNMIRDVQMNDSNFSGKIARISGDSLNKKEVRTILDQLKNGALIIQKASGMKRETAHNLYRGLQQESLGIIVVLEDTGKAMNKFLQANKELVDCFNARMDVQALSNETLVAFGRKYAREMEYSIDELGVLALHTRIQDLQTSDHAVTVMEVKKIVDEAISRANKKNLGHFFDILLAKRYDDEDMIILREKDFAV